MLALMTNADESAAAAHAAYMRAWKASQPAEWHEANKAYSRKRYASLAPEQKAQQQRAVTEARRKRRAQGKPYPASVAARTFGYCPDTGLVWRLDNGYTGYTGTGGYVMFSANDRACPAHRIAWCIMTGDWPASHIDHINGIRDDNRWENLRLATPAQNTQNLGGPYRNNKSGYLGVSPKGKKWAATIAIGGRNRYLGAYDTPELAYAAYLKAKADRHPFSARLDRGSP